MIMKLQGVIRLIAVCPLLLSLGMPIAYGQPVADKPGLQENPYQEFSLGAIKPAGCAMSTINMAPTLSAISRMRL